MAQIRVKRPGEPKYTKKRTITRNKRRKFWVKLWFIVSFIEFIYISHMKGWLIVWLTHIQEQIQQLL